MPDTKDFSRGEGAHLKRANSDKLKAVFLKYASFEKNGELYMTSEDFVRKYLGLFPDPAFNEESVRLLAGIADTTKDGLISFTEFAAFEGLLCTPDALYRTAFQLFDRKGNGKISYGEFAEVIQKTELHSKIPFGLNGPFIKRYFGKDKQHQIDYAEFTQLLHDFHEEYAMEAFRSKDPNCSGYISALDFQDIMVKVKRHLLTTGVEENLVAITQCHKVSYPYFMAFTSLLNNMELIKRVYLNSTQGSRVQPVTKDQLLYSAQTMSQITPLEIDILFQLTGALHQTTGRIVYKDLNNIAPEHYTKQMTPHSPLIKAVDSPGERSAFIQFMESAYRFSLGSIAGGIGASVVYPIDLVKTRMQNQRTGSLVGEVAYRNSMDCFKKVIRHEGVLGLYRGLVPQLMGVSPEKAIKLTMNDLVRDKVRDKAGNIPLWGEVLAGACAGMSQVIFTNPVEIVKIRLQVAGEIAGRSKVSALAVVRELGIFGIYKGATACLLRDIPFSGIYFTAYAHTKAALADEEGYNNPMTLLTAGAIAGIPAASLVTPADVIKTRLQVAARTGQTTYTGIPDAVRKIMAEEGPRAFWKGCTARVLRSSPQFGVTLFTYELLQRFFYIDFGGSHPTGSDVKTSKSVVSAAPKINADHIGGYSVAVPMLNGIESKFGLCLPRFGRPSTKGSK